VSTKEKREFEIRLKVKEKGGKVQELRKKVFLEITWEGSKGILNPGKLVNYNDEYGKGSYKESKGEKVRFEKDGKNYDIIVKINEIEKGWFKDKIKEFGGFSPAPGSDFVIENERKPEKSQQGERRMFYEEDQNWKIKSTQLRRSGPVLVGIVIFLIILMAIIYFWKRET